LTFVVVEIALQEIYLWNGTPNLPGGLMKETTDYTDGTDTGKVF
jgi:hypothetical protein